VLASVFETALHNLSKLTQ